MEATSAFFAVRSGNDVIPTVGESEVFSLWSAPGIYSRTLAATDGDSS
jgi:hypothetical protein